MNAPADLGRVTPGAAPAEPAEWAPESGPQREALRSGEWVSEPDSREQPPALPGRLFV
jgi:hypothetical protein